MLHTFYLADFTFTGVVNIKVASLGATALNIEPIAMTKREGGYSAEIDVPAGAIAVSYQSADDPRTIDINEIVIVGNAVAEVDFTPVLTAIAEIPTNPLLATSYTAPDNAGIADLAQAVAGIPTTPAPAPSAIASAVQSSLSTQLDTIAADAAIARKGVTNNKNLNLTNDTGTLYDDDNETPVVVFNLAPSAIDSTSRTRRP